MIRSRQPWPARPLCRRVILAADLGDAAWPGALTGSGFVASRPAVFVAEGSSCYLSEDQNAALLDVSPPWPRRAASWGST